MDANPCNSAPNPASSAFRDRLRRFTLAEICQRGEPVPEDLANVGLERTSQIGRSAGGCNLSPHDTYQDQEATEAGSDRGFGCTVGSILIAIGAVKGLVAGAVTATALVLVAAGALLALVGIVAPARLAPLKRLWLRLGTIMAAVVNPVVLAILFLLVVTPMAWLMRLLGKRPLRLAPDPAAPSYWIARDKLEADQSDMRRQF